MNASPYKSCATCHRPMAARDAHLLCCARCRNTTAPRKSCASEDCTRTILAHDYHRYCQRCRNAGGYMRLKKKADTRVMDATDARAYEYAALTREAFKGWRVT